MTEEFHTYEKAGFALLILSVGLGISILLNQLSIDPASVGVILCALSFGMIIYGEKQRTGENQ